jgi:autonomous glycyl radical cofactor GrcA
VQDTVLREKLRKTEALFAGAATHGERDAAEAAMLRVKARLAELERSEQPVEMQFSIQDQWAQHLFIALCRRYGLRPYRRPRQKPRLRLRCSLKPGPRHGFPTMLPPRAPGRA